MLKLKLQYFGHLMQRVDSLEKTLMLGGIGGRRRRGRQRMRWLDGVTNLMDMSLSELQELIWTRLRDWTELNWTDQETKIAKLCIFWNEIQSTCWDSWGHKESDTTERLNWTELNWASLCLLVGAFNPFTFKVIIDKYEPIATYFIVLGSSLYSFFVSCLEKIL